MIKALSHLIYRCRHLILLAALGLLAWGIFYGIGVFSLLHSGGLDDPKSESYREARLFERTFSSSRVGMILLLHDPTATVDQPEYKLAAQALLAQIRKQAGVVSVISYYDTGAAELVSHDQRSTYFAISLNGNEDQQTAAYLALRRNLARSTPLKLTFGGPIVADYEINQRVQSDIPAAEVISAPILLILLVLIFRSVVAALLPLGIGALSILCAFGLTHLVALHTDISVFATHLISLLGLGLAIDYSLLFVSRFREELDGDCPVPVALERTLRSAGESIFFSGSTVTLCLLGMLLFPQSFLRSMGIGGALATISAVIASLTVLPAILATLGRKVNRGAISFGRKKSGGPAAPAGPGVWFKFSHFVMRHAVIVLVLTLGLLLFAGTPFLHTRFADSGPDSMPADFQSRISADALRRDFGQDQHAPIQVIVKLTGDPVAAPQLTALEGYVDRLKRLPDVRNVDSLVTIDPRIPPDGYATFYSMPGLAPAAEARRHYASGNYTLVSVNYKGDTSDLAAQALVRAVRETPPPVGTVALVGGDTAELVDQLASLRTRLPIAASAIIATTFVLLCGMLRSLFVPLKAVLMNVLSLAASFGLMTYVFQDGHLQKILHFTSSGSLDADLPVLIFCLAFGLATDYEVFLVSRIREEYLRIGDNTEAIAIGVEKTGQIITSAALLLIVVVAAFGMSDILAMKEMGVGLATAVAIDAAIVRTLLVPATMRLFGDLNWWLPFGLSHRPVKKT